MSAAEQGRPSPEEGALPGVEADAASPPAGPECEVCGAPMYELHCKIVCPRCGYKRDCSDP